MENRNKPAYPQPIAECNGGLSETLDYNPDSSGLTKREMIAAMALQGLMSCNDKGEFNSIEDSCAEAAHFAVKAADALLTELSKS